MPTPGVREEAARLGRTSRFFLWTFALVAIWPAVELTADVQLARANLVAAKLSPAHAVCMAAITAFVGGGCRAA